MAAGLFSGGHLHPAAREDHALYAFRIHVEGERGEARDRPKLLGANWSSEIELWNPAPPG